MSRKDVDPDALRVLYRLHSAGFEAYLVGGSVRDLLLGRRPKDYDIGTSANPHEVKRLFRNCWIIGRRFRLAHVRFGTKTIEVATFRRQVSVGAEPQEQHFRPDAPGGAIPRVPESGIDDSEPAGRPIARDNEYGTPEEDAFRRDFTVNALFYDIGSFSVIDYTGGLQDLQRRMIRCIGDPDVRFVEDPVRMLRALVLAARLDFGIDEDVMDAIGRKAVLMAQASPARLLEEYYKILRSGHARSCFDHLADSGLLEYMSPELLNDDGPLTDAFAAVDTYRRRFDDAPETLTNAILAGTLLLPLGLLRPDERRRPNQDWEREAPTMLGAMQVARKDIDRLRHLLLMQRRLLDLDAPARAQHALMHRSAFREALTWLEIHGQAPDVVAHWHALLRDDPPASVDQDEAPKRRRRQRRRPRGPSVERPR